MTLPTDTTERMTTMEFTLLDPEGPLRELRLDLVGKGRAVGGVDHAAVPKMGAVELFRLIVENGQDVRLSGDRMGEGHRPAQAERTGCPG